ncbi:VWA domain-containing protein [Streptomyces sp. NPDC001222]|uniref:VWA domain-containing protein n=1 Tax=Streptomyces sp. NPDC001222 TaxID=3364548 RepID=UPI0036BC6C22
MGILTLLRNAFGRSRKGRTAEGEPSRETTTTAETAPASAVLTEAPASAEVPAQSTGPDDEHELVSAAFDNVTVPRQATPQEASANTTTTKPTAEQKPEPTATAEPEPEPEAEERPEPVAEDKPEPQAEERPEPEVAADPEPVAEETTEPEATEAEPTAEKESEPEVVVEPGSEAAAEATTETAEPEAAAEPEPAVEAEPEATPEPEAAEPEAEAAAEVTPEAQPTVTAPGPEATQEPEPEPEPVAEATPEPTSEPAAETTPEPQAEAETETEQPEPVAEATPEAEPEAKDSEPVAPAPEPVAAAEEAPIEPSAPADGEAETTPDAEADADAEVEVEVEADTNADTDTDADADAKPALTPAEVKSHAPGLTTAYKAAATVLDKHGLAGTRAKVYLVLDRSASMRPYYKDGSAQALGEQALALAAHLDPEATVHVVFFSTELDGTGELTLAEHENKIDDLHAGLGRMGRTSYHAAVEAVTGHHDKSADPALPALVIFQTDGAPDAKTPATQSLADAAKSHPALFFSFVAFGDPENKAFDYLRKLKSDNTAHFLAGETPRELTDTEVYEGILANWRP